MQGLQQIIAINNWAASQECLALTKKIEAPKSQSGATGLAVSPSRAFTHQSQPDEPSPVKGISDSRKAIPGQSAQ